MIFLVSFYIYIMKFVKNIRDPIHGNIPLTELELNLLDTPQVQRMRRIKQNGLCFLVYSSSLFILSKKIIK